MTNPKHVKRMQQTSAQMVQDLAQQDGKGDPLRLMQEIEIWPCSKMVRAQTRICPGEWDALNSLGFETKTDHLIPPRRPYLERINKKRWTYCFVDVAVPEDNRVKRKRKDKQIIGPCKKSKISWGT